jgi:hypothetical protein
MPSKQERVRIAILDDYQNVALSLADWSVLSAGSNLRLLSHRDFRGFPAVRKTLCSPDLADWAPTVLASCAARWGVGAAIIPPQLSQQVEKPPSGPQWKTRWLSHGRLRRRSVPTTSGPDRLDLRRQMPIHTG